MEDNRDVRVESREPMTGLVEEAISCPYCGEPISVLIDTSVASQRYIEDCQVCCQPIEFAVELDPAGEPEVSVFREDD